MGLVGLSGREAVAEGDGERVERGLEVQVCASGPNVLITSRNPDDLPAFCQRLVTEFQPAS